MVAVTGATGHLGTVLVCELARRGERVRYLARAGSRVPALDELERADVARAPAVERVDGGLFDRAALARAFGGADVVYHCAGLISFWPGNEAELHRVNVEGTRSVLAAARAARVRRFVHVGSVEAFPLAGGDYPVSERHGIDPEATVLAYGRTKAQGMLDALAAAGDGMDVLVCAPTAFVGPPDYRGSALGTFVLDYLRRRLPAYVDGGFDFVDVRDVADGVVRAGERGASGRVYLLGGEYATIPHVIGTLEEASGVARPLVKLPVRAILPFAGIVHLYCRITGRPPRFTRGSLRLLSLGVRVDSSRARDELGYQTRPLRETLSDTVGWFADEGLVRLDAAWDAGADRATGPAE
ncbi:MAG: NAD-dependent epimerase/dehydratase family protein [bacterium]